MNKKCSNPQPPNLGGLKIGFLQQHNTSNVVNNIERLCDGIRDLAKRGAELVVLQELHNSLYFCQVEDVNLFDLAEPIQTSVGRLGVLVCWDQWYPEAARLMALAGAELLIYPTAIGYDPNDTPDEQERQRMAWQTVMRGHAVANGLPVVAVNRVGDEDGVPFWGTSFVCGPQGELYYEASTTDEESIIVDIDMKRSEQVRRWWPFLRDRRIEAYGDLTKRFRD